MPAEIWEVSDQLREETKDAVMLQYESNNIEDFLDNQVEVIASLHAEIRFLRRILHE